MGWGKNVIPHTVYLKVDLWYLFTYPLHVKIQGFYSCANKNLRLRSCVVYWKYFLQQLRLLLTLYCFYISNSWCGVNFVTIFIYPQTLRHFCWLCKCRYFKTTELQENINVFQTNLCPGWDRTHNLSKLWGFYKRNLAF